VNFDFGMARANQAHKLIDIEVPNRSIKNDAAAHSFLNPRQSLGSAANLFGVQIALRELLQDALAKNRIGARYDRRKPGDGECVNKAGSHSYLKGSIQYSYGAIRKP
jgi:hypothetical protein